ncbi:protein PTHB1 [Bactrocera dorsalis]|uniref:Protein PTHB1 n=1 Tax=Bactrocera dorsalis TaxID=27457 RepID=A0A6I9VCQ2_BACDO|nr:protein PTHB1 [Bactrocera dorsalis]
MSLFNVCNWWHTQCSDLEENYDVASLLCARFGLDDNEKDYVVVGSHSGNLSIFNPRLEQNRHIEDGNAFRPTDLLLEVNLKQPILGIYAGRFSGGQMADEKQNQLAVLHPRSVVIYKLNAIGGVAEHGAQLRLQSLADYKLKRGALALTKGSFGRVKGREFFCITHLDGTLTFHEQDGILYECQLPGNRALPVPVVYCERTDSFLRFTAGWNLECFTYQDLSHSSLNRAEFKPSWSVCIGEGIVDMCVVQAKSNSATIMVLGERNFISLTDDGLVDFILKLDYTPSCFYSFVVGYYWEPGARLITAIASDTGKLFIYEGANIIWAAQYKDDPPVAIQRSNLYGLPGGIVALGATGQLRIGYLGSEPFVFKVPSVTMEDLSFTEAHKELQQLEEEIKAAVDVTDLEDIDKRAAEDVRIQFTIKTETSEDADVLLLDVPAHVAVKELPACTGILKLRCKIDLAELQVVFNTAEGVRCSQDTLTYVDMTADRVETLELEFYVDDLLHMHTARVDVVVSFISVKGIPRVLQQSAYLPLNMFYKTRQPQKSAGIKLTYNIMSKSLTPKLSTFFPEFVTSESDSHALGLLLLCPGDEKCEEVVTIVLAKNSNRIRIQSDTLETFPMILERIMRVALEHAQDSIPLKGKRVKNAINSKVKTLMANPVLPIHAILSKIDLHRETQENIRKQTLELDKLLQQFKTLQRKLQDQPEDESKETLVMQIEENYDHLIAEGDKLMEIRKLEKIQRCDLTCAISVATSLIGALRMEEKLVNVICSVLCTPIEDWTELSWEESMSPGIDMLYHYGPLNRVKNSEGINAIETNVTHENFDYNRFRRHILSILERIQRIASAEEATVEETATAAADERAQSNGVDISGLNELLEVLPSEQGLAKIRMVRRSTLEAVEDDEEEDEDDLRKVGYKKEYGNQQNKSGENSDWVNEDYELPTSEELFSDLGIWW